jgi:hypothetical protein
MNTKKKRNWIRAQNHAAVMYLLVSCLLLCVVVLSMYYILFYVVKPMQQPKI